MTIHWVRAGLLVIALMMTGRFGLALNPEWTTPLTPFRIADHLYYVGSRDLASYLVVTPDGDILVNSSLESSVPLIERSVEQLGFRFTDIKILLISHAHFDHAAGSAEVKRLTRGQHGSGAEYMVMDGDVATVESGGAQDLAYPKDRYPSTKVDRVLHDGDAVRLGGVVLVAHKTAGHTPGCTTWTMRVTDQGQQRDVVIVGSWNVNPGYRLVDTPATKRRPATAASYPGMAADYRKTFLTLKSLPCDIFLGAHGGYFDMLEKLERAKAGAGQSVWIDSEGYRAAIKEREQAFEAELRRQQGRR
ncbi:Metallo-beta-lactamase precursor [Acidisarcina polymorpha]|uniref:Metallo-beta-lactamase n=1 Tax=Acidisarcina polymorpha TaxID=2211140 RepID=A0A2Z5G298_9BACT|nr:subclass B3 metallo-beta-lactamase [Acidisarcina polymorpha]AXC13241.1 Metallo-beta-lactamase precursor [Acidisarcina polymorpha]